MSASTVANPNPTPRLAYSVSEIEALTGVPRSTLYDALDRGDIPKLSGIGSRLLVPAWALEAWAATGDWRHPDWRPVPPGADPADTPAEVIPLHPDAS